MRPGHALRHARQQFAQSHPTADELHNLLSRAAERNAGLCPRCLAEVKASYLPFPPPLTLTPWRLAGDGFVIEAEDRLCFRRVGVLTPPGLECSRRSLRLSSARGAAVIAAWPWAFLALLAGALGPSPSSLTPLLLALTLSLVSFAVYFAVRYRFRHRDNRSDQLVNLVWRRLVSEWLGQPIATRFLARLAASSLGRGYSPRRARHVRAIQEWAIGNLGEETDDARQHLLAALEVLRVDDAAQLGQDRLPALVDTLADCFTGRQSLVFAEHAIAVDRRRIMPSGVEEISRLRVLLLEAAFAAGLTPTDLSRLWMVTPMLRQAMSPNSADRLGLLYGVWKSQPALTAVNRPSDHRSSVALPVVETIYDFCRKAPNMSGSILAAHEDLLLICRAYPELGPLFVTGRGVVIGDRLTANPEAWVECSRQQGNDGKTHQLVVGAHRWSLATQPDESLVDTIRFLLRFRHEVLMPFGLQAWEADNHLGNADRLLRPLARRCPECECDVVVAVGAVGVALA